MANYSTLKAAVADVVKTNGAQAITGANLQSVLLSIINSVGGGGYIFKGVATPSTSAGTPDENVFYLGGAGTYANFGTSVTVPVGSICVFKYNGSWTKEILTDGLFQKIGVIDSYWELVIPNITTGALTLNGTNRIGYVEYIPCHAGDVIESEYQFIVLYYTEPTMNSYVLADSKTSWNNNTYTFAKDGYFRVALRYSSNNENITEEMKEEMIKSFAYSGNVRYIQEKLFPKVGEYDITKAMAEETYLDVLNVNYNNTTLSNVWRTGTSVGATMVTTTAANAKRHIDLKVKEGQQFIISAVGGSTGRAYYMVDDNNVIVDLGASSTGYDGQLITIPTGATKLIVQTNTDLFAVKMAGNLSDKVDILDTEVSHVESRLSTSIISDNMLPENSRFDSNSVIVDGNKLGIWSCKFVGDTIAAATDGFVITLNEHQGSSPNAGIWFRNNPIISSNVGKDIRVKFSYKAENELRLTLNNDHDTLVLSSTDEWKDIDTFLTVGTSWSDYRVFLYSTTLQTFYLKNMSMQYDITMNELQGEIDELRDEMQQELSNDFGLTMKNYRYKIGSIEREESNQCVIGLLGDSWTQHNGASYLANHSNYVQPIASYLRNKYGNAGGGFYSFSISHIGTTPLQKMASVDPADADDERSATGITYQDQIAGVKGIDAADAVFGNGTYLTLNVLTQHNKFVIHFWGASEAGTFTYSLDGASPVSVDASQYTGHSTITITTTDTTHTLRFDVTSGSVMLFGVDMQRTASGVRVHKFGNKGATSSSFVSVDADAWKAFVQTFNLDSMTILLGMNDGPNATTSIYDNLKTIISRIKDVNQFCDLCVIAPAGGKNYDFTSQAAYQEMAAKEENIGYINLIKLFGNKEQITAKNTFVSDGIHPTLAGGRMIADYIIEKLLP